MGYTADHWREHREKRKKFKLDRKERLEKHLPVILAYCDTHGITHTEVKSGYQFKFYEYFITWSLSTNTVCIQYAGGGTKNYTRNGANGKPRILVALEELAAVCGD